MADKATLECIEDFLAQRRIAMVGISRDARSFSMSLYKELCGRGYDVVPVNPQTKEVMGRKCYARVQDIEPPVDGALLMTSPGATEAVVRDCAEAGIRRVWMYRAGGVGAVSEAGIAVCQEKGIRVVPGECPLMFLPQSGGVHRVHGWFRKLTGRYPRHLQA
ncbi:MAG TPA: CoA-binding protein [Dongiaceae bacterium]|nr:CoA-binding protein [Dongiaceae bacterium]